MASTAAGEATVEESPSVLAAARAREAAKAEARAKEDQRRQATRAAGLAYLKGSGAAGCMKEMVGDLLAVPL